MPATLLKKATIYAQKHRSGNVTWIVFVGKKNNGKKDLRRFSSEPEAQAFMNEWNLQLANQNLSGLHDLTAVAKHEVLAAIKKLELVGAKLPEAIDFFLKFAHPAKGKISVRDAV